MAKHRAEVEPEPWVPTKRIPCGDAFCDRQKGHENYDHLGHMIDGSPT